LYRSWEKELLNNDKKLIELLKGKISGVADTDLEAL
jgi:hypothetical protein